MKNDDDWNKHGKKLAQKKHTVSLDFFFWIENGIINAKEWKKKIKWPTIGWIATIENLDSFEVFIFHSFEVVSIEKNDFILDSDFPSMCPLLINLLLMMKYKIWWINDK